MFPYMEEHITVASPALYYDFDHARALILEKDPFHTARDADVVFDGYSFSFLSLKQEVKVSYPECRAVFTVTGKSPDLQWHMPILHYLSRADGTPLSGECVPIRYLDRHIAHPELFESETGGRLLKYFDGRKDSTIFEKICADLGGEILGSNADLFARFDFLPKVPIYVQLWMSDDEMPGTGKMMFDKQCFNYLDEMDIHCCGPLMASFLIKHHALLESGG